LPVNCIAQAKCGNALGGTVRRGSDARGIEKRLWPVGVFVDFDRGLNKAEAPQRAAVLIDMAELQS
jgi:hypothetical protein